MKKVKVTVKLIMVLCLLMVIGNAGRAATLEGTILGLGCLTQEIRCPVDKTDPRLLREKVFVLSAENNAYHFISSVDPSILRWNIFKKARITGEHSSKYNTIAADKLEVLHSGKWREVWSREAEEDELEAQYGH